MPVFQLAPSFQLSTWPEVLYLVWRSAMLMFASPHVADFSTGRFSSA
jgi:hypothetical protein